MGAVWNTEPANYLSVVVILFALAKRWKHTPYGKIIESIYFEQGFISCLNTTHTEHTQQSVRQYWHTSQQKWFLTEALI